MVALLLLHFVAAIFAPLTVRKFGRNAFFAFAAVPTVGAVWAALKTPAALSAPPVETVEWVPALHLTLHFRLDVLAWLMMIVIGTVGGLVMIYSARYFADSAAGLGRFGAFFLAFSGAMIGVVVADQTMTMYVFWELTAVLSYLLIGQHSSRAPARSAARQSLLVTGLGGLVMFSGLVIMGMVPGGSFRSSDLTVAIREGAVDVNSPLVITAAVLILVGGLSKSAQVPFHFWLPGAMAAPTPVSAFLHSAAMVKAGVVLVARFTPGFYLIPGWSFLAVTLGFATMVVGGYRALRQKDLKLVLAHGTVSQLGMMMAAVGWGTAGAMAAGLTMLLAHAAFKSSMFLSVGAVETATGTRDLREISGLGKKMPILAGFTALSALSMAAVPPSLGYVGKEAFIVELFSQPDALVVFMGGAIFTVAYAIRLWWGAFGTKPGVAPTEPKRVSPAMLIPIATLSVGALLGAAYRPLNEILTQPGQGLPGHPHLALWSGPLPAVVTAVILVGGVLVPNLSNLPESKVSAVRVYGWLLRETELTAARVTSFLQTGSLPAELGTIFVTMTVLVTFSWLTGPKGDLNLTVGDSPIQAALVVIGIATVIVVLTSKVRMKAAIALGGVGLVVATLFAAHGAPDLALTQLAVEAVSVVVFVLVLRKMPRYFSARSSRRSQLGKAVIGVAAGVITTIGGYYALAARTHEPVSALMPLEALKFGHGENIVNVILVDIRAWDTMGELSVLLVTATGVASLIYIVARSRRVDRLTGKPTGKFLPAAPTLQQRQRSMVLEVSTRLLFPTMLMLSLWLLLIGHNNPGGGFVGGVVAGLAFVLRYLAGGRYELGEAASIPAGRILGAGLFVAAFGGAAPLLYGNAALESTPLVVPLLDLHFTTALILDIGVYLVVVGLIIELISALGAEIDRQSERTNRGYDPAPEVL